MHQLANQCCSVLSGWTSYVTGALFIKGMTSVTTLVSLGIYLFFDVLFCFFLQVKELLADAGVVGVARGTVCLHCW